MDDTDRATVRDDQDVLAGMPLEDVVEKPVDAGGENVEGLRVVCAEALPRLPAAVAFGKLALDLVRREPLPGAEATLAKSRVGVHLQPELLRDDLRGLSSSCE